MKTKIIITGISAFCVLYSAFSARAGTTIDSANKYAYGANVGWLNAYADGANGAVIGEYVCSGYLYVANVGWIHLGSGSPADGIQYQNNSATDFGVNQDGLGSLRGYAWGANIGWINFEDSGAPKVDLYTGRMSGYVWSANSGWISLSNAVAYVQTDAIAPGADTDGDGIPDAWEYINFRNLTTANATSDTDHDGVSDKDEYLAGTNPNNAGDYLRITAITRGVYGPTYTTLQWTSVPTRFYAVQQTDALGGLPFADLFVLPFVGANNAGFDDYGTNSFYRIRAFRPLTP